MSLLRQLSEQVGYTIHTNRELGLMLRGDKLLAVFADVEPFPDIVSRYLRLFDRHCAAGRLEKREYVDLGLGDRSVLTVMYALPNESWRIDAMIELRRQLASWSPEAERMEGSLLGRQDWQNDIWLRDRFGQAPPAPD